MSLLSAANPHGYPQAAVSIVTLTHYTDSILIKQKILELWPKHFNPQAATTATIAR